MSSRIKTENNSFASWILFFASPFLSVVFSIKNFRQPFAKNMIWAFTIFYGLTFVISDEGMDSSRYKYKFIDLSRETISFTEYASTFYDEEGQTADVVDPTIQ
ncbi:MAG: hypothetical protein KBG21_08435, partial [Ignavibacteria bacterium]|nr:hypothetical protein [Ignavibacteria bacterium]